MESTNPLNGPRRQRPGAVITRQIDADKMDRLDRLESLLKEAQTLSLPRELRLSYLAEIRRVVAQIRDALPAIDAPPAPPREARATNPSKVTPIRETRPPRGTDPNRGREQNRQDAAAVRTLLESVEWINLSGDVAAILISAYAGSRPALRKAIRRELLLLGAKMTEAEDNRRARVILALHSAMRGAA